MIHSFFKHFRIFLSFARASFQADLEYRMNFLTRILTDVVWYGAQILTFETLYLHMDQIGGWTLPEMRVFLGIVFVTDAIYMILYADNMDRFSDKVRKGDLDLLLMKPVNSQMMVSLQRLATALIGNLVLGGVWLIWALTQLPELHWERLLLLLLYIPIGSIVLYCIRFMLATTAIMFTRADSLQYAWYQVYKLGLRPDSIYQPWVRYLLLSLIPVLAVIAVPAQALVKEPDPVLLLYVLGLAVVLLYASHRFWRYALSKYSSASS